MSIEVTLKDLLGPLVGGRAWPDLMKEGNTTFPFIVYQQVGGRVVEYVGGQLADKDHCRMQVVVWSKNRLEASALARDIREAIVTTLKGSSYGAPVSLYEEALKAYGARIDFSIWYTP